MDNPSLWQKLICRFNGIPLKGEQHPPKALLRDIGKKFYPPDPFPIMPKDFKEYPERDLVNFPNTEIPMFPPKTRLYLFPDSWFQPFYKVTGVSGPYLLLAGLYAFLLNKEFIVVGTVDTVWPAAFITYFIIANTIFSYRVDNFFYNKAWKSTYSQMHEYKDNELKEARDFRKKAAELTESMKAVKEQFPTILRENLALQLEATYRYNAQKAYAEIKSRLDYLSEVSQTKKRFERDILLKSIIGGVQKQIETNEGKIRDLYLDNCILKLKTLSPS